MADPSANPRKTKKDRMIGQVLADRYEIQGRLGKGGMAVVYKAQDRSFGRSVAIKVLRTDIAKDPVAAKRLIREARAAGQLHHPHIITMHDVGTADGMVYIVMEVLVGSELSDVMEQVGAIDVLRSLEIARQVASGLAVAHRAGIIHRDIKPENLFLIDTESGGDYIKMLDFSIAKLPSAMVTAALTRAGSVFGTPHYMAPEQVEGRTVCTQTDLYALGAVLYECIAGQPPFDGDSVIDILLQHARSEPPKLSALGIWLPDGLSELVDGLLAKKESERPESATVVEHMLERMIDETRRAPSRAPPTEVRPQVSEADIEAFRRAGAAGGSTSDQPPPLSAPSPVDLPAGLSEEGPPPLLDMPPAFPGASPPPDLPVVFADLPGSFSGAADSTASETPHSDAAQESASMPADLPGAAGLGAATLIGAGLAVQVRAALAEREANRTKASEALAAIAAPPATPAPRPPTAARAVSAPSSIVIRNVPPPPVSRARLQSKLRRETLAAAGASDAAAAAPGPSSPGPSSPGPSSPGPRTAGPPIPAPPTPATAGSGRAKPAAETESALTRRDLKVVAPSVRAPLDTSAIRTAAQTPVPAAPPGAAARRRRSSTGPAAAPAAPAVEAPRSLVSTVLMVGAIVAALAAVAGTAWWLVTRFS